MKYIFAFVFLLVTLVIYANYEQLPHDSKFQYVRDGNRVGFEATDCWFTPGSDWPKTECYRMHVPEDHANPKGRMVSFPLIVFKSDSTLPQRAPILHLGGGGPGSPMNLSSDEMVETIWQYHDAISLNQGRDLYVIDPRGTGLSEPLLTCDLYVDGALISFQKNLSLEQEKHVSDQDYRACIENTLSQGINLNTYNSFAVANDIELLRRAANVQKWVLLGVSYGSIYAQIIASQYTDSIESMVLDSSTFPEVKAHKNYLQRAEEPYLKLFNYCLSIPECDQPIADIERRIWQLYRNLSVNPIVIKILPTHEPVEIDFLLNGERFLAALFQGIYYAEIFYDLPHIVTQLEDGKHDRLLPYLEIYIDFMLDRTYGDLSANAHYCYEEQPFVDNELIAKLAQQLPEGYIRDTALLTLDWPDYCEEMQIKSDLKMSDLISPTNIPTLFLHGKLDTVTPLRDVRLYSQRFAHNQIVTFDLSHSILTSSACAEVIAGLFVHNPSIGKKDLSCE